MDLEAKWKEISGVKTLSGYRAIRITSDCNPELYLGLDKENSRCLILFLPQNTKVKLKETDLEKLKIHFLKEENLILIRLIDTDFSDLFNDLVISIYSKIKEIDKPEKYSRELISHFYKWAEFFEDNCVSKLSFEEIKGLWGELFVLNESIMNADDDSVNSILESWRGPYDQSNDFIFDKKNLEIKTKDFTSTIVKISSEFQLETEIGKKLELIVISLRSDLVQGKSIRELVSNLANLIRAKLGDTLIMYKALRQKQLTVENLKEYDNHKFVAISKAVYNCSHDQFPKLIKSNIPPDISHLKYWIQTLALSEFLIEEKIY